MKVLNEERFDRERVKSALVELINYYISIQGKMDNMTSGELTNRVIFEDLTLAETNEVCNYFYNGGYQNYDGYDYNLW